MYLTLGTFATAGGGEAGGGGATGRGGGSTTATPSPLRHVLTPHPPGRLTAHCYCLPGQAVADDCHPKRARAQGHPP
eukprot:scaffold27552_cov42-Phaeocystis_antarctica.AAC.1